MDDFIARHPILNSKSQVYGYHLKIGQKTLNLLNEIKTGFNEFGQITQSLFFKTLRDLSGHMVTYLGFSDELAGIISAHPPGRDAAAGTVIVFDKDSAADAAVCQKLKSYGFALAFDSTLISDNEALEALADVAIIEFTSKSLVAQSLLIKKYKGHKTLLAKRIDTWNDFDVAKDMGFELFCGFFFLTKAGGGGQKDVKSLDICMITILSELEKPEPNFKSISDTIEHDLGLSYKLLRLVNSAYMAPRFRIKSISQALTYLGTRELHQWISMLMFYGIKNEKNSVLIEMSLIRGKLMALVAQELKYSHAGAEPFFTGLFSLIDVILNNDMVAILMGLPLPDDVKTALQVGGNRLSELLDFVVSYEQADWRKIGRKKPSIPIAPQRMATLYIEAHKWANLADHSA